MAAPWQASYDGGACPESMSHCGAPDSVDELLDERGCHLVMATGGNQHRQVEFAQAGGDIPRTHKPHTPVHFSGGTSQ
jgi:hypothetical protein